MSVGAQDKEGGEGEEECKELERYSKLQRNTACARTLKMGFAGVGNTTSWMEVSVPLEDIAHAWVGSLGTNARSVMNSSDSLAITE